MSEARKVREPEFIRVHFDGAMFETLWRPVKPHVRYSWSLRDAEIALAKTKDIAA